jgi:large subunit ribosomal protein L17
MRHRKHNHLLGVKTAHRISLLANLSCSLIENGRIKTTLAKARALRPTIEKVITLAKKAHVASDAAQKVHYRRLAIARLRNKKAVKKLFDELVEQFANRNGGYTRIYKLAMPRLGDAADMAIIEFVEDAPKKKSKKKKSSTKKASKEPNRTQDPESDQLVAQEAQSNVEGSEDAADEPATDPESKEDSEPESKTNASYEDAETSAEESAEDAAEEPVAEPESKEDSASKDEEQASKD